LRLHYWFPECPNLFPSLGYPYIYSNCGQLCYSRFATSSADIAL